MAAAFWIVGFLLVTSAGGINTSWKTHESIYASIPVLMGYMGGLCQAYGIVLCHRGQKKL